MRGLGGNCGLVVGVRCTLSVKKLRLWGGYGEVGILGALQGFDFQLEELASMVVGKWTLFIQR